MYYGERTFKYLNEILQQDNTKKLILIEDL